MSRISLVAIVFCLIPLLLSAAVNFDAYFENKTMRIDYFHIGNSVDELITIDKIYDQGEWAGSTKNLIDKFNNGRYYVKVFDAVSGELLYSRGFDSYFAEYKTSTPALNGTQRTFQESALIPYPKNKIRFAIERRDKNNILNPFFAVQIDPADISIIREKMVDGVTGN